MDKELRLRQLNQTGYDEGFPPKTAAEIREEYQQKYRPLPTPATHPELFDPMDPPPGWVYDAHYEFWYAVPGMDEHASIVWITVASVAMIAASFWIAELIRP